MDRIYFNIHNYVCFGFLKTTRASYDMYYLKSWFSTEPGLHVCCDDKDAVWKARRMARRCEPLLPWTLLMGIISLPSYEMYWKADSRLNQSSVSSVMTKARYEKLSQYIHLADNSAIPNTPGYDPLYKVRPLLETCERTFRIHYATWPTVQGTASTREVRAHIPHSLFYLTHCTRYGLYSRRASAHSAFTKSSIKSWASKRLLAKIYRCIFQNGRWLDQNENVFADSIRKGCHYRREAFLNASQSHWQYDWTCHCIFCAFSQE